MDELRRLVDTLYAPGTPLTDDDADGFYLDVACGCLHRAVADLEIEAPPTAHPLEVEAEAPASPAVPRAANVIAEIVEQLARIEHNLFGTRQPEVVHPTIDLLHSRLRRLNDALVPWTHMADLERMTRMLYTRRPADTAGEPAPFKLARLLARLQALVRDMRIEQPPLDAGHQTLIARILRHLQTIEANMFNLEHSVPGPGSIDMVQVRMRNIIGRLEDKDDAEPCCVM